MTEIKFELEALAQEVESYEQYGAVYIVDEDIDLDSLYVSGHKVA